MTSPHGRELKNPYPFPEDIWDWLIEVKRFLPDDRMYRGRLALLHGTCLRCGRRTSPTFNNLWNNDQGACRFCAGRRAKLMNYSLVSFRTGAADPAQPIALYAYEFGNLGKVGIGRPLHHWERRRKGLPPGRRLHRVEVPALVASTAEEMLLSLLQGDEYGRGPDVPPTLPDGNTERFRMEDYYRHRQEVKDIFRWAEDPSSLDDLLSILHTPWIEPYFGPVPPTTPPTFTRQETA